VNPKTVVVSKSQNQQAHEPKKKVMDEKLKLTIHAMNPKNQWVNVKSPN
jgi:hypothetical protein